MPFYALFMYLSSFLVIDVFLFFRSYVLIIVHESKYIRKSGEVISQFQLQNVKCQFNANKLCFCFLPNKFVGCAVKSNGSIG